jgi:RNA-directed DNA polymerase
VSDDAAKAMRKEIRSWRLHNRSDKTLGDLARVVNPIVQGWINYYGRFYRSELHPVLRPINDRLGRWAQRKYKRLRRHPARARRLLADVARREPRLFAHWRMGLLPDGWAMGAR